MGLNIRVLIDMECSLQLRGEIEALEKSASTFNHF